MAVDETYVNSLSIEELRRELRYYLDLHYEMLHALRDVPEMAPPFVLLHLGTVAKWPEDSSRGKELQRKLGLDAIPPKSECECGAGLWDRILNGLARSG